MQLIDIGNKFNEIGKNLQVSYSRKLIDKSPSVIGLKNEHTVVILKAKPIESNLSIIENNIDILRITENIYMTGAGLESDIFLVHQFLVDAAINYKTNYGIEATTEFIINSLNEYLNLFSSILGARVLGADFMIMTKENGKYSLVCTTEDLICLRYRGNVIGSMKRAAITELESYDLESLDCNSLVDVGVKTFFKSFDPLVSKEFTLEVGIMSNAIEKKFYRLSSSEVKQFIDRHNHLTIEDIE